MRLVLDVENTVTWRDGKTFGDPYEPDNFLVQVGVKNVDADHKGFIFNLNHKESMDIDGSLAGKLQAVLDKTTLLIMHNAQHDMAWLWQSGFKYDGAIYDTMLAEYVLHRGTGKPLSLAAVCMDRNLPLQKADTMKEYLSKGVNVDEQPLAELEEYLYLDLGTTSQLFHAQEKDYSEEESQSLVKIRDITFKVCLSLTRMNMSGIKVDMDALEQVRTEFLQEKDEIQARLGVKVRDLMGDTPINLNSPEQLSQLIFSRKVDDKTIWVDLFDSITDTPSLFQSVVKANTTRLYKTIAHTCKACNGTGRVQLLKKDGTPRARLNLCKECDTKGYWLEDTREIAGLGFEAPSKKWVSANGFSTSKDNLDKLIDTAKEYGNHTAVDFLGDVKRLSALSSYLSSFVDGIRTYTKQDGFLHVSLTQHITHTGRFSGRNPNMQNMPRGGTFPVKRVFVSRFPEGSIMEADFAQLEFRVAAFLSQDAVAIQEIATGFDVHSYTAKIITDAGQKTSRQEAKAHTFAPLFGATGYGRTTAEAAYYEHFTQKYEGIAEWHGKLAEEALTTGKITNVSGRQYAFPYVERRKNGTPTYFTNIKNYPVQGFATGDIVPVVLMEFEERLRKMNSCIVNTVHDSLVVDIHPNEKNYVLQMVNTLNDDITALVEEAYDVRLNVPMLLEAKIGPNWLDTKDV